MKGFILTVTMLLSITLIIAAIPTESEASIYEDTVRLHILARSDGEEDQATKLLIRDKILEKYSTNLSGYESADEAADALIKLSQSIEDDVNLWLTEIGCDYTASVVIGEEWYEAREYDGFTLPAGIYTSLRIMLGGGEGKNWWCVMFPPMCLDIACEGSSSVGKYTDSEIKLISGGGYNVKFKILELASGAVKKLFGNG